MIRFNNDYNRGAHPEILKALQDTNAISYGGYGKDEWCEKASAEIRKYLDCPQADVHFLVGGTQANYVVIESLLRPFQSVVCADTGHIHVHETGAVEHSGHKIQALPNTDGKISAAQVAEVAQLFVDSPVQEHITQPKVVYISFPTEYGTIYSKQELTDIYQVCRKYGLYLFVDGARLGYGLGSCKSDLTIADLAHNCDVFYCGGTKCGAMFGEAVVFTDPALSADFRSYIKMSGAMLAKGWLLGVQFYTLFKDGLYFDITRKADEYAMLIKEAFAKKGIPSFIESYTNQQFVILENSMIEKLNEKYIYEYDHKIDDDHACVRFCTAWSTREEDVQELISDIEKL